MIVVRSRWLLPIADRPMLNGWVAIDRGRIAAAGRAGASLPMRDDAPLVDLGAYAVLPALVNAHVHLELSWLRGLVPRAERFTDWVPAMLQQRMTGAPGEDAVAAAVAAAIAQMRASGTGLVGEISNSLVTVDPLRRSTLEGVVFHEVVRLAADEADDVLDMALRAQEAQGVTGRFPVSLAPHAPYSVSPRLFQGLRAAQARTPFLPSSVHLAESPEEVELLDTGEGPWRQLLERLGAWDPAWTPPACSPVRYLEQMRVLGPSLLAVHAVQCTDEDLGVLRARGTTVVTCPRSNRYVGVGDPPAARFYRSGVAVAVGTDSLASNDDLNVFAELAALRHLAPAVPAATLLESATLVGARALGLETTAGTIEPGKPARLIAVALPPEVVDVEEYLVSGVTPDRVHWVEDLIADCGFADRA
ncbi:MAG: amidohydrolase family protein [Vicinamibacteria bacterium]|nr:amidohydrolase family protein [Vicinamibacteria bacterium]